MKQYNVIFFGTTNFSATILNNLAKSPAINLQLVVTQPQKFQGRKQKNVNSPVSLWANSHNIPLLQPLKVNIITSMIKKMNPDFLITAAYGQIIPQEILDLPKIEALNVHGSLLPKYRGGAPIQRAILQGESTSGVTIMRMIKSMDAGPIFGQTTLKIDQTLTGGELMNQMAIAGGELLNKLIIPIAENKIKPQPQNEAIATYAYNIKPQQEKINWNQSAQTIHNHIRALAPIPGAFTLHNNQRIKIFKTLIKPENTKQLPGTISKLNKSSFEVQTQSGILEVFEVQQAGKNKINGGAFAYNHLKIGDRFNND